MPTTPELELELSWCDEAELDETTCAVAMAGHRQRARPGRGEGGGEVKAGEAHEREGDGGGS